MFRRPDADIAYEIHGNGHPLLIMAPGGLRSQLAFWRESPSTPGVPPAWMNPMVALAPHFTVVAMDQRNAGASRAKVRADDGWHSFAQDQLALMDHLGHRRFHIMGGCIGGSFCFALCKMAPERITAAVLQNPISLHENRDTWDAAVSGFIERMRQLDPSVPEATIRSFGKNLFGGDFVFSVDRDFVKSCKTPLMLLPGTDKPHPAATSAEIAKLAKGIEVVELWRGPDHLDATISKVTDFLLRHTPEAGLSRRKSRSQTGPSRSAARHGR